MNAFLDYKPGCAPDPALEAEISSTLIYGNTLYADRVMGDPVTSGVRNLQAHLRAAHDERMVLRRVCIEMQTALLNDKALMAEMKRQLRSQEALIEVLDGHSLERATAKRRMPAFVWRWLTKDSR
jgi:hypothetical protein